MGTSGSTLQMLVSVASRESLDTLKNEQKKNAKNIKFFVVPFESHTSQVLPAMEPVMVSI